MFIIPGSLVLICFQSRQILSWIFLLCSRHFIGWRKNVEIYCFHFASWLVNFARVTNYMPPYPYPPPPRVETLCIGIISVLIQDMCYSHMPSSPWNVWPDVRWICYQNTRNCWLANTCGKGHKQSKELFNIWGYYPTKFGIVNQMWCVFVILCNFQDLIISAWWTFSFLCDAYIPEQPTDWNAWSLLERNYLTGPSRQVPIWFIEYVPDI